MSKERLVEDLNTIIRKLESASEIVEEGGVGNFDSAIEIIEAAANTLNLLPALINDSRKIAIIISHINLNKNIKRLKDGGNEG